jgi:hypothetical protein
VCVSCGTAHAMFCFGGGLCFVALAAAPHGERTLVAPSHEPDCQRRAALPIFRPPQGGAASARSAGAHAFERFVARATAVQPLVSSFGPAPPAGRRSLHFKTSESPSSKRYAGGPSTSRHGAPASTQTIRSMRPAL